MQNLDPLNLARTCAISASVNTTRLAFSLSPGVPLTSIIARASKHHQTFGERGASPEQNVCRRPYARWEHENETAEAGKPRRYLDGTPCLKVHLNCMFIIDDIQLSRSIVKRDLRKILSTASGDINGRLLLSLSTENILRA